jgi:DNA-binding CsgD family transcriptional regulator
MTNKNSKIPVRQKESDIRRLSKKTTSVNPEKGFSSGKRINIHILSKAPFTIEGLKFFLEKHIGILKDIIISCCSDKCRYQLNISKCRYCCVFTALKDFENYLINNKACSDNIILIDDHGFLESSNSGRTQEGEDEFLNSLENFFRHNYAGLDSGTDNIKIIIFTGNNNAFYLKRLIDIGLKGLIHGTSIKDELLKAIETVNVGGFYIDTQISNLIFEFQKYISKHPINNLTNRQIEILNEISNNFKNHQIAPKLKISIGAVEKHKSNIENILNLNSDEIISFAANNKNEILYFLKFSKGKNWK